MDRKTKIWRGGWMLAASVGVLAIVVSLVSPSRSHVAPDGPPPPEAPATDLVAVTGHDQILVKANTPLAKHLNIVTVVKETVSYPLLRVTGSVVARIRPGNDPIEERWQFANAEVAGDYADWLKTSADIMFNESQLKSTQELSQAQIERYQSIVDHIRPLAPQGAIPGKEMRSAEADLVQAKLQAQKDVFAAQTALRLAQRQRTALERQLSQAGIEAVVLSRAREGMVLISANVPESKISSVKEGQACEVRFYSFPGRVFSAAVEELGTVLSTERRTLRVLFDLQDTKDELKPGMFAEVGLGTDEREALLIPVSAVLHIGRSDYVFKQVDAEGHLALTEVQVSESQVDRVEVLQGLAAGDRIVGTEAVLLKPLAVQSLTR